MENALSKAHLHLDDLNRIRLIEPEVAEQCQELETKAVELNNQLKSFKSNTESMVEVMEELAVIVEAEKLRAMESRNSLKRESQKDREAQQLQIIIRERQVELERLRAELAAAEKLENDLMIQIQTLTE
ncbi:hypothetical protein WR25_17918 [Diploscapter pachys]|uniref:Uncharacterized protein n=1 Tax=Diploscapter pachys TaxID=2018661 RepID=A0A2A2KTU5_9BILA|nr:hypothetical protein WR25_17918 [Diploscapter pachys]